jgi:hypothetical protein
MFLHLTILIPLITTSANMANDSTSFVPPNPPVTQAPPWSSSNGGFLPTFSQIGSSPLSYQPAPPQAPPGSPPIQYHPTQLTAPQLQPPTYLRFTQPGAATFSPVYGQYNIQPQLSFFPQMYAPPPQFPNHPSPDPGMLPGPIAPTPGLGPVVYIQSVHPGPPPTLLQGQQLVYYCTSPGCLRC